MNDEHPNIHTYIADRWCVSTVWRQCSSAYTDHWYYETHVWGLNESGALGGLLHTSGNTMEDHFRTVRALLHNGEEGLIDLELAAANRFDLTIARKQ